MANKLLIQAADGTPKQIVFANHATLNPATDLRLSTDGSLELDVEITLTDLAGATARQSAKVDLGENRAAEYVIEAVYEFLNTIDAGETVSLYWAPSRSGTAGTANPANVSGADAAYDGYSDDLLNAKEQLMPIAVHRLVAGGDATINVISDGQRFSPPHRYGSLVVRNDSDDAMHSDAVEMHITFTPILPELQ